MNNTIDYNGVQITLTPEQLAHIENETKRNKYKDHTSIKSFEDACDFSNISDPCNLFSYVDSKRVIAFKKLEVIVTALNNGWTPNWNDSSEYKHYNYFRMLGGFSYWCTDYYGTGTDGPSVLCFKTEEIAEYAAKQFIELYKDFYL